jgi:hypothetical protein
MVQQRAVVQKDLSIYSDTISSSGDNEIQAAPGSGKRLRLAYLIVQNKSTTAVTIKVKFGSTQIAEVLAQNQGDGLTIEPERDVRPPGGDNEALIVNLSAAENVTVTAHTYEEDV